MQQNDRMRRAIDRLHSAESLPEFLSANREILDAHGRFVLDRSALEQFSEAIRSNNTQLVWHRLLSRPDLPHAMAFWEFTFNAALNGGYFAAGEDGRPQQWQVGGSGSEALLQWIASARADQEIPGQTLRTRQAIRFVMARRVEGIPHSQERLEILEEFADSRALTEVILASARTENGYHFTLKQAALLAHAFPTAFAGDPFRKKAILALNMISGFIAADPDNKLPVLRDLPIPADYQIPRILTWKGIILPPASFIARLNEKTLIDVTDDDVMAYRAAAVIACHEIARRIARTDAEVDGILFGALRNEPSFHQEAPPPMMCDSLWF